MGRRPASQDSSSKKITSFFPRSPQEPRGPSSVPGNQVITRFMFRGGTKGDKASGADSGSEYNEPSDPSQDIPSSASATPARSTASKSATSPLSHGTTSNTSTPAHAEPLVRTVKSEPMEHASEAMEETKPAVQTRRSPKRPIEFVDSDAEDDGMGKRRVVVIGGEESDDDDLVSADVVGARAPPLRSATASKAPDTQREETGERAQEVVFATVEDPIEEVAVVKSGRALRTRKSPTAESQESQGSDTLRRSGRVAKAKSPSRPRPTTRGKLFDGQASLDRLLRDGRRAQERREMEEKNNADVSDFGDESDALSADGDGMSDVVADEEHRERLSKLLTSRDVGESLGLMRHEDIFADAPDLPLWRAKPIAELFPEEGSLERAVGVTAAKVLRECTSASADPSALNEMAPFLRGLFLLTACPDPLARWMFDVAAWHPNTHVALSCTQTLEDLLSAKESRIAWVPAVGDIVAALGSLGASAASLSASGALALEALGGIERSAAWAREFRFSNYTYVLRLTAAFATHRMKSFGARDLCTLFLAVARTTLDRKAVHALPDATSCLARLLECIDKADWLDVVDDLCAGLARISGHHENLFHAVQLVTPTDRGMHIQRRVAFALMHALARRLGSGAALADTIDEKFDNEDGADGADGVDAKGKSEHEMGNGEKAGEAFEASVTAGIRFGLAAWPRKRDSLEKDVVAHCTRLVETICVNEETDYALLHTWVCLSTLCISPEYKTRVEVQESHVDRFAHVLSQLGHRIKDGRGRFITRSKVKLLIVQAWGRLSLALQGVGDRGRRRGLIGQQSKLTALPVRKL